MVKIRLKRIGAKKRPFYRIVAADSRCSRDGRFIELLGTYDPNQDPPEITIKRDRIQYWLDNGARPSDTTRGLLKSQGFLGAEVKREPKPKKAAKAKVEEPKAAAVEVEAAVVEAPAEEAKPEAEVKEKKTRAAKPKAETEKAEKPKAEKPKAAKPKAEKAKPEKPEAKPAVAEAPVEEPAEAPSAEAAEEKAE